MAAKLEIQAIGALYLDIRTLLPLLPFVNHQASQ